MADALYQSKTRSAGKSEFLERIESSTLEAAVSKLFRLEKNNNGRLPHGSMRRVLLDLKLVGIHTDRDRLNYLKKKRKHISATTVTALTEEVSHTETLVSDLTEDSELFQRNSSNVTEEGRKRGRPTCTKITDNENQNKKNF